MYMYIYILDLTNTLPYWNRDSIHTHMTIFHCDWPLSNVVNGPHEVLNMRLSPMGFGRKLATWVGLLT